MTKKLLRTLESLPYNQRVQQMIQIGNQIREKGDQNQLQLIHCLEQGAFYERFLALYSCWGSHDTEHIVRATQDPSQTIRLFAYKLAITYCTNEQIQNILHHVNRKERKKILFTLAKKKRSACVDSYLDCLKQQQASSVKPYFSFGSASWISTNLEFITTMATPSEWEILANKYPKLVLEHFITLAKNKIDRELYSSLHWMIIRLFRHNPEKTISLLELIKVQFPITAFPIRQLVKEHPQFLVDHIIECDYEITVSLADIAHRINHQSLLALLEKHPITLLKKAPRSVPWLHKISPEIRESVFQLAQFQWRDADGIISPQIIELLPKHLREQEARRHLQLDWIQNQETPIHQFPYIEFLPWDEIVNALHPHFQYPDESVRAQVLATLVSALRFHRNYTDSVLQILKAKQYESDIVKQSIFQRITELPISIWQENDLPNLDQVIQHALDARDLSHHTSRSIQIFIIRLLDSYPTWSTKWISHLVKDRGNFYFMSLEDRLSEDQIKRLKPSLLPILQAWRNRERDWHLVEFARSLGRHLSIFEELVDLLVEAIDYSPKSHITGNILSLLESYRRDLFQCLVPKLLKKDRSWIVLPVIYNFLHQKRQDLLHMYLDNPKIGGRFTSGRTYLVLPFAQGFYRWTQNQQEKFAGLLQQVIIDPKRDLPTVQHTIRQLSQILSVDHRFLLGLASHHREMIRDWSIQALGRLDQGQGASTLLKALEDKRARVAIYSLRRTILNMKTETAVQILMKIPTKKVTIFKEVLRLLGDLHHKYAYQKLIELDRTNMHRDVHIAYQHALWNYLDEEKTWRIYEEYTKSENPFIAKAVCHIPFHHVSPIHKSLYTQILLKLLTYPDPSTRSTALNRVKDLLQSYSTENRNELLPLFIKLTQSRNKREARIAAETLFTFSPKEISFVIQEISSDRYSLNLFIQKLLNLSSTWRKYSQHPIEEVVQKILGALESDPHTIGYQIQLAISTLPFSQVGSLLERYTKQQKLTAETLIIAIKEISRSSNKTKVNQLEEFEEQFRNSPYDILRRLALAALQAQANCNGWQEDYVERLKQYRQDPSLLVAAAAQFTMPEID